MLFVMLLMLVQFTYQLLLFLFYTWNEIYCYFTIFKKMMQMQQEHVSLSQQSVLL